MGAVVVRLYVPARIRGVDVEGIEVGADCLDGLEGLDMVSTTVRILFLVTNINVVGEEARIRSHASSTCQSRMDGLAK
jgi:hypothetical protein